MSSSVPYTIATQPSSRGERRLAVGLVACLATASVVVFPFHLHAYASTPAFIAAFSGTTGLAELLTAALLFFLYRVEGVRAVLAIGSAYLLTASLMLPYTLTFPGVVTAGVFIGNEQSASWLWILWHLTFPIIILSGLLGRQRANVAPRAAGIIRAVALVGIAAALATYAVTVGRNGLPILVTRGHFSVLFTALAFGVSLTNAFTAGSLLRRMRPLSTLQLWLVVALTASALDMALNAVSPARYSLTWYVGKVETFVTSAVVLISLLVAWSTTYARSTIISQRLIRSLAERRSLQGELERERYVSTALQDASLPHTLPLSDRLRFDAAYHPGSDEATIGGDWYDAFRLDDGRFVMTIGDVMGSGIRAAVTMTKLRQAMQAAAMMHASPAEMLDVAEKTLRLHDPLEGYATALALIYDPASQRLEFSSAGHFGPLLRLASGAVTELSCSGTLLGVRSGLDRDTVSVDVPPEAMLVLYTDGLVELTKNVTDGQARLVESIADSATHGDAHPARAIVRRVLDGHKAKDDIAVLTISFTGVAQREDAATSQVGTLA